MTANTLAFGTQAHHIHISKLLMGNKLLELKEHLPYNLRLTYREITKRQTDEYEKRTQPDSRE